jgi:4a-hydroxytetrahydrobiopterin dehydratase
MPAQTASELRSKTCKPCEGGVDPLSRQEAERLLSELRDWQLSQDGKKIQRKWQVKDFSAGLDFLNEVGKIAEDENHHPDLHLVGYKNVEIELSTHAIGGLSENDFIVAAKIDEAAPKEK